MLLVTGHARWYGTVFAGYADAGAHAAAARPSRSPRARPRLFDALISADAYPALRAAVDAGVFLATPIRSRSASSGSSTGSRHISTRSRPGGQRDPAAPVGGARRRGRRRRQAGSARRGRPCGMPRGAARRSEARAHRGRATPASGTRGMPTVPDPALVPAVTWVYTRRTNPIEWLSTIHGKGRSWLSCLMCAS